MKQNPAWSKRVKLVAVNVNPAVSPLAKPAVPSETRAANKEKKK